MGFGRWVGPLGGPIYANQSLVLVLVPWWRIGGWRAVAVLLLLLLLLLLPRTNKPALCLGKIRKCRSADWKGIESENAENADA